MIDKLPLQVKPDDDVISQALQDEIVLLKLNGQQYYSLDQVAAHAWKLLMENGDVEAVAERLCENYVGNPATIRSDFHVLVGELIEAGLLRAV